MCKLKGRNHSHYKCVTLNWPSGGRRISQLWTNMMRSFVLSYRLIVFFQYLTCAIISSDRWWYIRHLRCAIFQTVATNLNLHKVDARNPRKKMNPKTLFFLLGLLLIIHSVIQTIEGSRSYNRHVGRKRNEVRQGSWQSAITFPLSLWSFSWQLIPEIVQTMTFIKSVKYFKYTSNQTRFGTYN